MASFNWSRAFWKPLNLSKTMNILAMKGPTGIKSVTQLWVIGKIKYAMLAVNQFLFYTVKLYLTSNDCNNLRLMLKKEGNLSKDWDFTSLELMVNFSTRPNKVKELIQLIVDNKEAQNVIRTIHWQDTFPFIYDIQKSADVNTYFPDSRHNIDDFKLGMTVVMEFQILLRNFKASNIHSGY